MGFHGRSQEGERRHSMSETSHVLGSLLASSPLLTLSWRHCARASSVSSSFVVEECDGAVYVAFSGTVQVLPPATTSAIVELGVGFFSLVSIETGRGRELFPQLGEGGGDDGDQPVQVLAGAGPCRCAASLYELVSHSRIPGASSICCLSPIKCETEAMKLGLQHCLPQQRNSIATSSE